MLARDVAPRAEISSIARVHPLDYIETIRAGTPTQGRTAIDEDTCRQARSRRPTERNTSSGTIRPSCMPRRTKCRTIPAQGRSGSAAPLAGVKLGAIGGLDVDVEAARQDDQGLVVGDRLEHRHAAEI